MEPAEYRVMFDLETTFWWYRNLHDILSDILRPRIPPHARLLDAGCGTGGWMLHLKKLSPRTVGFDYSPHAADFWQARDLHRQTCLASTNELPYPANHFDFVTSINIIESDGVDDKKAFAEIVRVTRPGGYILVLVSAYEWMKTEGHHQAVHAIRRYNKTTLSALAEGQPVHIERMTHAYAFLFPLIAAVRLWNHLQARFGEVSVESELGHLPQPINALLYHITNIERHLLRRVNMPFGSTLIMLAQKNRPGL